MRTRRCILLAATALVLAACSGDSDNDSAESTASTESTGSAVSESSAPSTTESAGTAPDTTAPANTEPAITAPESTVPGTTQAPPETEAEWAESALLTLDDFVEGWTEVPSEGDDELDDAEIESLLAECTGLDESLLGDDVTGDNEATSPEIVSPDGLASVTHTVGFAPDTTTALAAITAIGDESIPDCYLQAINTLFENMQSGADPSETFPPGLTISDVTVDRVDLTGVAASGEAVWYKVAIAFEFEGQTTDQYLDLIFLRNARVLSQLELTGNGVPFPDDLIDPIVGAAMDRAVPLTLV